MTEGSNHLFLHVGPHKTGSTYLQKMLNLTSAELLNRGLYAPRPDPGPGHAALAALLRNGPAEAFSRQLLTIFQDDLSTGRDVLLSAEGFSYADSKQVAFLKRTAGERPVVCIYVHRPAFQRMSSMWREYVSNGGTDECVTYAMKHLAYPKRSRLVNPCLVVDRWAQELGPGSVRILDYDALRSQKEDLWTWFLKSLGRSPEGVPVNNVPVEPSLSFGLTEVIRALNVVMKRSSGGKLTPWVGSAVKCRSQPWVEGARSLGERIDSVLEVNRMEIPPVLLEEDAVFRSRYRENVLPLPVEVPEQAAEMDLPLNTLDWMLDPELSRAFRQVCKEVYESCRQP